MRCWLPSSIPFVMLLLIAPGGHATIEAPGVDDVLPAWANPARVEPLEPDIGSLLGVDLPYLLGNAQQAYEVGDFDLAARYYLLLLRGDLNHNAVVLYNLACCYALMSRAELASVFLLASVEAGMEDISYIESDPDFDSIRDSEVFIEAMSSAAAISAERELLSSEETLGQLLHVRFPAMQEIRLHVPADFDPDRAYPAVVAQHGYSGDATEFSSRWSDFRDGRFFLLCPRAPYAIPPGAGQGFSWIAHGSQEWLELLPEGRRAELWSGSAMLSVEYVLRCVEALRETYDVSGVYLLGFSQGGRFCYMTGLLHPDLFDGIATFTAPMMPEDWPVDAAPGQLRIFVCRETAEDDRALRTRDYFESHGYDVTFREYEGAHRVPAEMLRAFEAWMAEDGS